VPYRAILPIFEPKRASFRTHQKTKNMTTTPPIHDWDHQKGYEIPTKHKEAIRELATFGKKSVEQLSLRYELGDSTIRRILSYEAPECARPGRTGPKHLLTDKRLNEVIEYLSEKWANRILKYNLLVTELNLDCASKTLMNRLHQRGYYRCTACQKQYLTANQVIERLL
jgi:hypothetical protein